MYVSIFGDIRNGQTDNEVKHINTHKICLYGVLAYVNIDMRHMSSVTRLPQYNVCGSRKEFVW